MRFFCVKIASVQTQQEIVRGSDSHQTSSRAKVVNPNLPDITQICGWSPLSGGSLFADIETGESYGTSMKTMFHDCRSIFLSFNHSTLSTLIRFTEYKHRLN